MKKTYFAPELDEFRIAPGDILGTSTEPETDPNPNNELPPDFTIGL